VHKTLDCLQRRTTMPQLARGGVPASMFDEHGNLPAGFADWTLEDVRERLVDAFPTSQSRPVILAGYLRLRSEMQTLATADAQHWIDGSFSTAKPEPGDLDLLTVIDKDHVDSLEPAQQQALAELVAGPNTKATHHCDSYFLPSVPESHPMFATLRAQRKYWMGEFGFDREDRPKGIVRVPVMDPPPSPEPEEPQP
jgi:hypothetical protein